MKQLLLGLAIALIPVCATTQTQEETDKGYLVSLIEDNLSGATRNVNIIGFEGALSSAASLDILTVSDADGVWLTLENVVLDWNRSALLRGRIDVNELSAERIIVARPPLSENSTSSPEATAFALPELPVGIRLGQLAITEIILGEPFLGEEIALNLVGKASLASGEGNALITATRLGNKAGRFAIDAAYNNESRILALDLDTSEDAGGITASLLDLPGRPSTALTVSGTAPIDNFGATITLATDNVDRITGDVNVVADTTGRVVGVDLGGDVSALFAPEYQTFFGDDVSLQVLARSSTDGQLNLENLSLSSQALKLAGSAQIGAQGWPQRISLRGQIENADNSIVLLPMSGPKTYLTSADFDLQYDNAQSEDWTLDLRLLDFERPGLFMKDLSLAGGGILKNGEGAAIGATTAALNYTASGLQLDDVGAAKALGDKIGGIIEINDAEGSPVEITQLTLSGAGIDASATATIESAANGLRTSSNVQLSVAGLDRFSTLVGRDLSGSGDVTITSTITPLEGLFDIEINGTTTDLSAGIPQIDAILAGRGTIDAAAARDGNGTRLESLRVVTSVGSLTASANLTSEQSEGRFDVEVQDVSLIDPRLKGPATITGTATQSADDPIAVTVSGDAAKTTFGLGADIAKADEGQTVNFTTTADIKNLMAYRAITGRDLSGAATVTMSGVVLGDGQRFDADVSAETRDLVLDITQLDPLLSGDGSLSASFAKTGSDRFRLNDLLLETQNIELRGDANGGTRGEATATLQAVIPDARILDNRLSGPVTANIAATRDAAEQSNVTLRIDGPGTDIDVLADISPAGEVAGSLTADVANLAPYRSLIGLPVSGEISARIAGTTMVDLSAFDATATIRSNDLGIGNEIADLLLAGNGKLDASASLNDGTLEIERLAASTANLTLSGNLDGRDGGGTGTFDARLRDVGIFTDQLSGAVIATGSASLDRAGNWGIDANATGPGGINVRTKGRVNPQGLLNVNIDGRAPLGLANRVLEPRRITGDAIFDLALNGRPALNALTGQVSLRDAQLSAPTLAQGLSNIVGGVNFANGTARVNIQADVQSGGSVGLRGPVLLNTPQTADLTLDVSDVVLNDPELYNTSINGTVTVKGPLTGGARIAGQLNLGQTDVQVPSSGVGALGDLPDVTHILAPSAVRTTLARAGVTGEDAAVENTSNARPFPLDIRINAPSRIFIRGRGLDAELGGSLRIGGTTANVQPIGLFELVRGRIDILQQRFELTEGSASLQGDFEPYIRLVARTQARTGTVISIIVEGPASEPDVSFVSTPSLPQDEVLSQLIFGRDLQNISPLQAVQLAAAVGTLAGPGGGGLIDNFRQDIGLDDFDVTTDEDGNAAVRAGKYLSENVYTDMTVSSDGTTEVNINLDITDDFTAKGSVDGDGETSIGVFFEKDY